MNRSAQKLVQCKSKNSCKEVKMTHKIQVGVLGATGMVGQNYIRLLSDHPWFEISLVAASPKSAGMSYCEAVDGRWHMNSPIPESIGNLKVYDASKVADAKGKCAIVFSAVEMEKQAISALELEYAANGFAVISNNSSHRFTPDVPMIIPEINYSHLDIIPIQRKTRGWTKGLLAVKSNCSIQSYMTPVYALLRAGYKIDKLFVTTMQALSGAGYPGPSSLDIIDNVVPFIQGEEEKSENEPLKVLGSIEGNKIVNNDSLKITAHCNRVPVINGHTACISIGFEGKKPTFEDIISIWKNFKSIPQELRLPSAPVTPIIYKKEENRPQPQKDRELDKAMAVVTGRLRTCNLLDFRFVGLHHNTIRGAAGGAILTAELIKAQGFLG
jgi:aspartate-semialdehyde dehydrogenase